MSLLPFGLSFLAALIDWGQQARYQRIADQRRREALGILGDFESGVGTIEDFFARRPDRPSLEFDPSGLEQDLLDAQGFYETTRGGAEDFYRTTLDEGLGRLSGSYQDVLDTLGGVRAGGVTGLRDLTQLGTDELNRHRIELGSTFDLLGLADPEERYQEALTFGNEAAAENARAGLRSAIDDSFTEQARLGVDPFEAGAFDDTRQNLTNRRFSDLFLGRAAASGERERVQEFNVGARGEALGREMATNQNIDAAIAALLGEEIGGVSRLYGDELGAVSALGQARLGTEAGLLTDLSDMFQRRLTGIEGTYRQEVAAINNQIANLTQQGRVAEAAQLAADWNAASAERDAELLRELELLFAQLNLTTSQPVFPFSTQQAIHNVFQFGQ